MLIKFDKQAHLYWDYGDKVKETFIESYVIADDHVKFDYDNKPVIIWNCCTKGFVANMNQECKYTGVRTDTETHVVLTGNWVEESCYEGLFILVLPKR